MALMELGSLTYTSLNQPLPAQGRRMTYFAFSLLKTRSLLHLSQYFLFSVFLLLPLQSNQAMHFLTTPPSSPNYTQLSFRPQDNPKQSIPTTDATGQQFHEAIVDYDIGVFSFDAVVDGVFGTLWGVMGGIVVFVNSVKVYLRYLAHPQSLHTPKRLKVQWNKQDFIIQSIIKPLINSD